MDTNTYIGQHKLQAAKNWLLKTKSKTLVHALVYCEKGLKELVEQMLMEGKSSRDISDELHKKMDGRFDDWKIPSHMAIETYKKYFDDEKVSATLIKRSKFLRGKVERVSERFDILTGIFSKIVDLEEESEYFHNLRIKSKLPIEVGLGVDKLLLEYYKLAIDVYVRLGLPVEIPKELSIAFNQNEAKSEKEEYEEEEHGGKQNTNIESLLKKLSEETERAKKYSIEYKKIEEEKERLRIEEEEIKTFSSKTSPNRIN